VLPVGYRIAVSHETKVIVVGKQNIIFLYGYAGTMAITVITIPHI
jgi:hypothetical protein